MAQILHIDPIVLEQAPSLASTADTVAVAPMPVAVVQPAAEPLPAQALPDWYLTPVVLVPIAAAAFVLGNVMMMIPWEML